MPEVLPIPLTGPRQDIAREINPGIHAVRNARKLAEGRWCKRLPYQSVTTACVSFTGDLGSMTGAANCAGQYADRHVVCFGNRAYARTMENEAAGATGPTWKEIGRAARYLPRKRHWFNFRDTSAPSPDETSIATNGSSLLVAFTQGTFTDFQVHLQLTDLSGVRRWAVEVQSRTRPRVIVVGSVYVIAYQESPVGGLNIYVRTFNPTTLTLGTETAIRTRVSIADTFDIAEWSSTQFLLVWRQALTNLRVQLLDTSWVASVTGNLTVIDADTRPTIYGSFGEGVYVAYRQTLNAFAHRFSTSLTHTGGGAISTAASGDAYITRRNSTSAWVTYNEVTAGPPRRYRLMLRTLDNAGVVSSAIADTPWHIQLASRPFSGTDNSLQVWLHTDNNLVSGIDNPLTAQSCWANQRKYMLCTIVRHSVSSKVTLHPELCPDDRSQFNIIDSLPAVASFTDLAGTTRYYFITLTPVRTATAAGTRNNEANAVVVYEYDSDTQRSVLPAAGAALVVGGHLQELTSTHLPVTNSITSDPRGVENGFLRAPAILDAAVSAAGSLTNGTYQLCAVYEYIDVDGRRHRSAPSNVMSIVVSSTSTDRITLTVATYSNFEREFIHDAVQTALHIYATPAGQNTFRRVTPDLNVPPAVEATGAYSSTFNLDADPNAGYEILYTDGGVLPNEPAPSARFGIRAGDRVVLGGLFDPRVIEVSKYERPNEPTQFTRNPAFRAILPADCTGLAYLDEQIVAFSERGIFLIPAGTLPNDQGFPAVPTPEPLPTDVGCVDWRSIVTLPQGIIFQSHRGIYLLPRGFGQPQRISDPVQTDLGSNLVRATTTNFYGTGGTEYYGRHVCFSYGFGYVLVLDAETLDWVGRDEHSSTATAIATWDGRPVLLTDTPTILWERTEPVSFDFESTFEIDTGDLHPFGLFGRGKVQRLQVRGSRVGAGSSVITVTASFDGIATDQVSKGVTTSGTTGDLSQFTLEFDFNRAANSVRFDVTVLADDSWGAHLHGMSLLVEPEIPMMPVQPDWRA